MGELVDTTAAIQARDRQTLMEFMDKYTALGWPSSLREDTRSGFTVTCAGIDSTTPYLRVVASCGAVREYPTHEDVPADSALCNCGANYEHYFIKYEEE